MGVFYTLTDSVFFLSELTVKEAILFSAQLRLEKTSPVYNTPDGLIKHVEYILKTLGEKKNSIIILL